MNERKSETRFPTGETVKSVQFRVNLSTCGSGSLADRRGWEVESGMTAI